MEDAKGRMQSLPISNGWTSQTGLGTAQSLSAAMTKNFGLETPNKPFRLANKMAAECIAVLLLTFTATAVGLASSAVLDKAIAVGATIFVLASSFGHISGGLFNPAVTLCVALCGKIKAVDAVAIVVAQLCGSLFAAFLFKVIISDEQYQMLHGGASLINSDNQWWQVFIAEVIVTFTLCQTVMLTAFDTSGFLLAPLAIGVTHTMNILGTGKLGTSMNPAPTFGPAVVASMFGMGNLVWTHYYIYWAAPTIAACLETFLYKVFFTRSGSRLL